MDWQGKHESVETEMVCSLGQFDCWKLILLGRLELDETESAWTAG